MLCIPLHSLVISSKMEIIIHMYYSLSEKFCDSYEIKILKVLWL